ncbi:MAG: hypothetical protein N3A62_07630 [Thermodesulfovibrionales bacterium]|nr:hypothetical protein [Thermodesulfovibrionales bacterium]
MKKVKRIFTGLVVALFLSSWIVVSNVDAAGNGRGQMLRDGSGAGGKWQGRNAQRDCTTTNCNFTGTNPRGGYGDGTHPRPMDGTGFGARRR